MSDKPVEFQMTTARPVVVSYPHGEEPTPLHPNGILAGFVTESPSPEIAYAFHPGGRILRYADGGEFDERKAKRELKRRDEIAEAAANGDAAAVATVKAARKRSTGSGRGGTSRKASRAALNAAAAQDAAESLTAVHRVEGEQPTPTEAETARADTEAIAATDESARAAAEAEASLNE